MMKCGDIVECIKHPGFTSGKLYVMSRYDQSEFTFGGKSYVILTNDAGLESLVKARHFKHWLS